MSVRTPLARGRAAYAQPPVGLVGRRREFMQSMCSFSATTASIHLLFCANIIRKYVYFRLVQLTGLNSEAGGPFEEKCKLYIIFFAHAKISGRWVQKPAHVTKKQVLRPAQAAVAVNPIKCARAEWMYFCC